MGIPLIAGREFTESDNLAGPKVAIVNQQFVKKFLDGRNPHRSPILPAATARSGHQIVGVVKDSHYSSVKQDPPPPLYYLPWRQNKEINGAVLLRALGAAREPDDSADPPRDAPTSTATCRCRICARSMSRSARTSRQDRIVLQLAAAFAILATALAMLGLYGVMAH